MTGQVCVSLYCSLFVPGAFEGLDVNAGGTDLSCMEVGVCEGSEVLEDVGSSVSEEAGILQVWGWCLLGVGFGFQLLIFPLA